MACEGKILGAFLETKTFFDYYVSGIEVEMVWVLRPQMPERLSYMHCLGHLICFCLFIYLTALYSMWDLSYPTRIKLLPPAV